MFLSPLLSLAVKSVDVSLELGTIDTPEPPAPDLDPREFAGPDERIHLGDRDVEVGGDVFEGEKARLHCAFPGSAVLEFGARRGRVLFHHRPTIAPCSFGYMDSPVVGPFCPVQATTVNFGNKLIKGG
jgi:hypothetical protein